MTTEPKSEQLHIAEGLNYECTGCGKCCGGWSVPLTEEDYIRISDIDWAKEAERYFGKNLFRELRDYERQNTPYTHAIKEGENGQCPFLYDNLCFIHSKFGSTTKPSICQLFPYSFNKTPSGTYATISFYSMGAVNNSGKALIDQREYLEGKLAEFNALYPDHEPNWSQIQLSTGIPLTWDKYLEHEEKLIAYIKDRSVSLEQRFVNASNYLARAIAEARGGAAALEGTLDSAPPLNWLDGHLLTALHRIYFPVDKLGRGEGDFNLNRFLFQILFQGIVPGVGIRVPGKRYSFEELEKMPFPSKYDKDIEDLIYRYFFSRLFGKHYFGAGFGQLTLVTGFNHLAIVFGLIKLQSKAITKVRGANQVSYLDVAAAVRQLEKRFGETSLDGMAAATFETLMTSSNRVARVLMHS